MFHTFDELRATGVLWYMNSVLHERGVGISLITDDADRVVGWTLAPAVPFEQSVVDARSAAFEALCAQLEEPAPSPAPPAAQEPAPASLAEIVAAVVKQLGESGALRQSDGPGSVAAALIERPKTPTTIGADVNDIVRASPAFKRASFVASHASNADPNPVTNDQGIPNDGARW